MKNIHWFIAVILILFLAGSCQKEEEPEQLVLVCEEFRPYSYYDQGKLVGISVEVVEKILDNLGIKNQTIEVTTDWSEAMQATQASDNRMLFTAAMTADRKEKLQWVGPVMLPATGFVSLKTNNYSLASIDDAKNLSSIGVINGYPTVTILENRSFNNLTVFNNINEAIAALYDRSIAVLFDLTHSIRAVATADGYDTEQLSEIYYHSTVQGFLAFSPGVPSTVIDLWQSELDKLKKQGEMQQIYNKYLPGVQAPGLLTIYTEENPPQNYRDKNGNLTGSSVDIIKAIQQVIGHEDPITLTSWSDGYEQALLIPNSMLFSTKRTPQRDTLFHWIGPVCQKSCCLYTLTGSNLELGNLDDAKKLSAIGVPRGWAAEEELKANGFQNLASLPTPLVVLDRLIKGEVEAAVLNDIAIGYLADELGYNAGDIRFAFTLSTDETQLAFSKGTRPAYLDEWQQAFSTIRDNGTFENLWGKWYPGKGLPSFQ